MKVMERKQVVFEQILEDQKINHQYLVKDTKLEVTNQLQECQSIMDAKLSKHKIETDKVKQECFSSLECLQCRVDEDKLETSNNLIKVQSALHAQLKEQKVHTELIANEQMTSMADMQNRIDDYKKFTNNHLDKIKSSLEAKLTDQNLRTKSMDREHKASLASVQKHIDGIELKHINKIDGVWSAMEAQLSKLKVLTETTAKENLTHMADVMECIHKVKLDSRTNLSALREDAKEMLLEQKQISQSAIQGLSNSITKKNLTDKADIMECIHNAKLDSNINLSALRKDTKEMLLEQKQISQSAIEGLSNSITNLGMEQQTQMSFISRHQVHADKIAMQICLCFL